MSDDPEADWPDGQQLNMRTLIKEQDTMISELVDAIRGDTRWDRGGIRMIDWLTKKLWRFLNSDDAPGCSAHFIRETHNSESGAKQ